MNDFDFYPPEWYPHEATWLVWLHNKETWHTNTLKKAQSAFIDFIIAIKKGEMVHLIVSDQESEKEVINWLELKEETISNISFHYYQTNDSWIRDFGPDFLLDKQCREIIMLNWQYNAWGGKYPPYNQDNKVNDYIKRCLNIPSISHDFILEGGSFEVNGEGVMLTTKSCLLNPNRNPQCSQEVIEKKLKEAFNQNSIIWLEDGIVGDDTDGHIDDFARFVNPSTILIASEQDERSPNYQPLLESRIALEKQLKEHNLSIEVVEVPMPTKLILFEKEVLPASYLNFFISNASVVVPVFDNENDKKALSIISQYFPDRETIGISANEIVVGLGAFHCLSKQQPRC